MPDVKGSCLPACKARFRGKVTKRVQDPGRLFLHRQTLEYFTARVPMGWPGPAHPAVAPWLDGVQVGLSVQPTVVVIEDCGCRLSGSRAVPHPGPER